MIVTDVEVLRRKSETVKDREDVSETISTLKKVLLSKPAAIAIAAIQIGVPKRIFVMKIPIHDDKGGYIKDAVDTKVYINPEIIDQYNDMLCQDEGCLSMPGVRVNTKRYQYVHIKYRNEQGEDRPGEIASGETSQIFQHEIDHLNGVLMIDREIVNKPIVKTKKVGRNDPCPCGSGKKYKKCCGR